MYKVDWIIVYTIGVVLLSVFLLFVANNAMERTCEDEGGKLFLDGCRIGNDFYEIYPTDEWDLFDYTINKHPKTE